MPNIHPLLIHLPIALLTCSFLFDFVGMFWKKETLQAAGWWTMVFGTLGLASAIVSGLQAEKTVWIAPAALDHFQTHQQLAFVEAGIYATLLLWRIANRGELPSKWRWGFVGIALLGVVGIWVGAWYGGEMVYRFGVGVQAR